MPLLIGRSPIPTPSPTTPPPVPALAPAGVITLISLLYAIGVSRIREKFD